MKILTLLLIGSVCFVSACAKPSSEYMSPEEFVRQVNICRELGKEPVPVYVRNEPTKIYRVDCE